MSILKTKYSLPVITTKLLSIGYTAPDAPRMTDDIAHIRSDLASVVETAGSEGVIMLCHSAGGFLGAGAMEGLNEKAMNEKGKEGGVKKIIFLTAAVASEGHVHDPTPFMKIENGAMTCTDAEGLFFNDLSEPEIAKWLPTIQPGPTVWNGQTTTYCGWREVSSMYILCEKDLIIPAALQEQLAALAGSKPVVRIPAGHMPQLSVPERVARIVDDVVREKI